MTVKRKREARPRLVLTEFQLEFLRTGKTDDPETYLDWGHHRGGERLRRTFLSIRGDYPAGEFPWAERKFA